MIATNIEIRIITNDLIKIKIMREMECAFLDISRYTEKFYLKICEKAVFIAAFYRGGPCGYIAMYANDYDDHCAYITSIAVSPDYQKLGIGQAMLDKAFETARRLGMKKMRLEVDNSNRTAKCFYKKNFFRYEKNAGINTSYMIREKLT